MPVEETLEPAVDDAAELLAVLVADAAVPEELEEALEELGVGAVGWKLSLLAPKPTFDAKTPPTEMESVSFLPVRTNWPLELSVAVTCALAAMFGLLMA